jgi:hypothetical protein
VWFFPLAEKAQVGLVDQGGRLERLPRRLMGQLVGGELAQLVVDQRQELLGGVRVAVRDGIEDLGRVTHWHPRKARRSGAVSPLRRPGCATKSVTPAGV